MNGRRAVALIAGASSGDEEHEWTLSAAMAVVRAVLEREGRVLLGAESSLVVPLLLVAVEYLTLRAVESSQEPRPAPVTLAPVLFGDALEDRLLVYRSEPTDEEPEPTSMLGDFIAAGLVEPTHTHRDDKDDPRRAFRDLLVTIEPAGILTVGDSSKASLFMEVAESYAKDYGPQLWRVLPARKREDFGSWRLLQPQTEMPPPMFDGQVVGERFEDHNGDERLLALARKAAEEASQILAIDRVIGELFEQGRNPRPR